MAISVLMVTNNYPTRGNPHLGAATALQEAGLRKLGVNIEIAFFDRLRYGRAVYRGMGERILRRYIEGKFDYVHIQFGGIPAFQTVRACGARCIITFHGTDLHGGSPRSISDKITFRMGVYASRWAAARSAWNIVVSPELDAILRPITDKVSVIPTGVDYAFFSPQDRQQAIAKLRWDPSVKHIVFCDSMHADVKRRDIAYAALSCAKSKMRCEIVELHRVPHSQVPTYLNAADGLLLTSDKEGSPNIVKEAIATNLPIVSVNVGDVAERIKGISGCRIVPRNPAMIGDALVEILSSGRRANGREMKRDEIENMAVCEKVLNVYSRLPQAAGRVRL